LGRRVNRKGREKKPDKKPAPGVSGGGASQQNGLEVIPLRDRKTIESHLRSPRTKNVVYVTHVGVYAGDIYEFNGKQYLATWNLKENTVTLSTWDYLWGTSDTDDKEDLAITNETYRIYREKTGKGGDFLALSPVKLVAYPFILPVQ
jgi:broad specificity phosphatase PhoE